MGFLRTLVMVVLVFIVVRLARQLLRPGAPPPDPRLDARTPAGADLVRDPACGVHVPRASAIAERADGEPIFFCSEKCREAYARGERAVR
jgi:YHS domain-containing protein